MKPANSSRRPFWPQFLDMPVRFFRWKPSQPMIRQWAAARLVLAVLLAGGAMARGQILTDLGATAPVPGANDQSQLGTNGNQSGPDGLNYYTDNQSVHNAGEPGQAFTTGTNAAGYVLTSVALKTGGLGSDSGIGTAQPYYLHLYFVADGVAVPLQTNTSANITFTDGDWLQWTGLSVPLAPNSTYAWSFGGGEREFVCGRADWAVLSRRRAGDLWIERVV